MYDRFASGAGPSETDTMDQGIRDIVTRGALGAFAVNLGGVGLAFGLHVLLSRVLGTAGYGTYVYAITWVAVCALFATFGQIHVLVRFLPALEVEEGWPRIKGLLRQSTRLTLAASLVLGGLAAGGVMLFGAGLDSELRRALWLGSLLLPVLALTQLRQAALRGFKRASYAEIPERIVRPLLMISAVAVAAFVLKWQWDAADVMIVHLAALAVGLLIAHAWLVRALPEPVRDVAPAYETRVWLRASLPLVVFSAMHHLLSYVDILMVGSLLGAGEAGIYAAAARIAGLVLFGSIAINAIVAPMISQFHASERLAALQSMLTLTARANFAFAIAAGFAIVAGGEWVLWLFGPDFDSGYTALLICTAGYLVSAFAGSVGFLMTMTGNERAAARIMALSVTANIVLNAVLIPLWGLAGAATATAIATVMWNMLMLAHTHRTLNVDSSAVSLPWRTGG